MFQAGELMEERRGPGRGGFLESCCCVEVDYGIDLNSRIQFLLRCNGILDSGFQSHSMLQIIAGRLVRTTYVGKKRVIYAYNFKYLMIYN